MAQSILMAVIMVAATALTLAGVLLLSSALDRRRSKAQQIAERLGDNRLEAVFLFEDDTLIDANERGEALLKRLGDDVEPWQRLRRFMQTSLPEIDSALAELPHSRSISLAAGDGSDLSVRAEWLAGSLRLTISDGRADEGGVLLDRLSLRAMEDELTLLRRLAAMLPGIAWREDADGRVIWANQAYLEHLENALGGEGGREGVIAWPLPTLFAAGAPGSTTRATLAGGSGSGRRESWFDVMRLADGDGQLVFALPADSAHRAEKTRKAFVQTLTKTFATLPTGLAVFDRARRLQLFNPALADLTGLEPEFLTSRPGLEGFLNRLREKRILPEPRDFRSWSRRLLEIEKDAQTSEFEETWLLPSGQTYRVSATPHPDGALAFLIEDFTSEVHMSRNIRAELEICQNALDMLDEGIVLFAGDGGLVQANSAFSRLWTLEGEDAIGGITLQAALGNWREADANPALWDRIAGLANRATAEATVSGEMQLADGDRLAVRARRGGNGLVMIGFRPLSGASDTEIGQELARHDPHTPPDEAAQGGAQSNHVTSGESKGRQGTGGGVSGSAGRPRRRAQVVRASA